MVIRGGAVMITLTPGAGDYRLHAASDRYAIVHGSAERVLGDLPTSVADLVIADPPYSSGGMFRSDRIRPTGEKYLTGGSSRAVDIAGFGGDSRDQRSYFAWSAGWLSDAGRVLKPGAIIVVFTDWRQLPVTTDALQAAGVLWRGVAVWNKTMGRPAPGIATGQHEFMVWGTAPGARVASSAYLPGVIEARIERHERDLHQTPKPVALMERLCQLADPGGVVIDPFAGSGPTGVAAVRTGRRCIMIEADAGHLSTISDRMDLEDRTEPLFDTGEYVTR